MLHLSMNITWIAGQLIKMPLILGGTALKLANVLILSCSRILAQTEMFQGKFTSTV